MVAAIIHFSVGFAVRRLPQWLLRVLDGWSHGVALRRAQERQRRWLARTREPAAAAPETAYRLKPWRD